MKTSAGVYSRLKSPDKYELGEEVERCEEGEVGCLVGVERSACEASGK